MKTLPSQSELRQAFHYEPETGTLLRRLKTTGELKPVYLKPKKSRARADIVRYKRQYWTISRLIWMWMTGEDPLNKQVDHINRNPNDNRFSNLRLVTSAQNCSNRQNLGVRKHMNGKWEARITVGGTRVQIGYYDCPLIAGVEYMNVRSVLHPLYSS